MNSGKFRLDVSDSDIWFQWGPNTPLEGYGKNDYILCFLKGLRNGRFLFTAGRVGAWVSGWRDRCGRRRRGFGGPLGGGGIRNRLFALTYGTEA